MKKLLAILLAVTLLLGTTALADEPIKVTILQAIGGNDTNVELHRALKEQFKEWTGGKYELAVEEIPGVTVDVITKLKLLNAANNLPAIVVHLQQEPAFRDLMANNGRLLDLKPYFDADEAWQSTALPRSVKFNTDENGKMYTAPHTTDSYTGIYYNKEIFAQAGIEHFPTTWDEFWDACEKIKALGIAPLSLHTTETGWCPMLLATAYVASLGEGGMAFLNEYFPSNFNNEYMLAMAECLQKLFQYTTGDAIGGTYSLAANNFSAGKTAMIANGPWMIEGLYDPSYAPEGFADKVGYEPYPEGFMMSNEGEGYGVAISMDVPEEERLGAIEYLKFLATPEVIRQEMLVEGSMTNLVTLTDEQLAGVKGVMKEYFLAVSKCKATLPEYQGKWDPVVQTEVIEQELPNLATGLITPQEFVDKMTEGAQRYLAESQD